MQFLSSINSINSKVFIRPHSNLSIAIDCNHIFTNLKRYLTMMQYLTKSTQSLLKYHQCLNTSQLINLAQPAYHLFDSDYKFFLLSINELVVENNHNVLRIARRTQFVQLDIETNIFVVGDNQILLKFCPCFGGFNYFWVPHYIIQILALPHIFFRMLTIFATWKKPLEFLAAVSHICFSYYIFMKINTNKRSKDVSSYIIQLMVSVDIRLIYYIWGLLIDLDLSTIIIQLQSTMDITQLDFSQATPQNICTLIDNTLSGDNQKIANATKILKAYTKHKSSIKILSFILINAQNPSHRQMATILLKRNIVNLYNSLEINEQAEFRALLLNQYVNENMLAIQRGIAIIIGMLLPVIELDNWNQLKNLLDQALRSTPQTTTFILLNCILSHFKPPQQLYTYLINALQVPKLAEEAMKCVVTVTETQNVDDSLAVELIKIWEQSNWTEQTSLTCLQAITTLAQRRIKINQEIITWICTHIISNKKLSTKFRVSGLDFLSAYAQFNGKTLASKERLLKHVVETICLVCSQPFGQEEEEDGQPVQQIALWLIQTLSVNLKSKKIYPVLLEASTALINCEDVNKNNTGYLILGGMAQGCSEKLKKNLQNPIMNVLIPRGLSHPAPEVRGAAINALSYFSEYLIPDIVTYHAIIIPAMLKSIDDLSTKVAQKALIAVDVFFDNMEESQIAEYLYLVMPKFAQILIRQNSTPMMRNVAMSAIGSAIEASKASFEPYVQNTYRLCIQFLNLKPSPDNCAVRAQTIGVLGKLSNIFCGKDYPNRENFYNNYTTPVMEPIYKILINDHDPEVRESCFQFFYLVANAVQNVFENVFDQVIPQIFKAAVMKEPEKKMNDFSLDSDSEDDNYLTSTKASQFDEKAAAIRALGELANACPIKFGPYFDQAYKILDDHYLFFFDSVRIEVSGCYVNLTKAYVKSQNGGVLPQYQNGLPCVNRFPEFLQNYYKTTLIPRLIVMMTEEDSSRCSSAAINALNDLIKALGPVFIDQSIQKITTAIISLFQSQTAEELDDQEENEEEEADDTDAYIFEPLCADLIPTMCEVLQVGFLPSLNELQPYMAKFLQEREDLNDNIQMVGCLSQCFKFIPSFFGAHAEQFFQSLASLTEVNDSDLNRNIAYSFAEAIEKSPQAIQNNLNHVLLILKNMYDNEGSHLACKQNALAAICRSIIVFNPPMPYQVFVNGLVQSMPFKGDQEQESTALRCLIHLYQVNQQLILNHGNTILNILQNDLSNPSKYKIEGTHLETVTNFYNTLQSMK